MKDLILKLNESGSKLNGSSRFPYMEVLTNIEVVV